MQKEARKKSKKKQNSSSKKAKNMQKPCTCTTKFHTPPFLCDFFACFFAFLCVFFSFFCAVFLRSFFCVFSRKRTKNAKKSQIQSKKNAKAKTRTCLIAFALLFDCIFLHCLCIFVAFFVPFLHWFSGQMRVFHIFFFCIPRHPLVTCFCVFCAFFSGLVLHYFCIVYAFFYVLLCHQN